jgi:transposase
VNGPGAGGLDDEMSARRTDMHRLQELVRLHRLGVMVLGHSRHQYAEVVFDQRTATWLELHQRAFAWFGGVPKVIVPDNLKAAVISAAFGVSSLPELNRSYREFARHHGFRVDPTPPRSPKKKGKVESSVK